MAKLTAKLERGLEVVAGVALLACTPLAALPIAVGVFAVIGDHRDIGTGIGLVVLGGVLLAVCAAFGWKLLTRRENQWTDGPMAHYLMALMMTLYAGRTQLLYGPDAARPQLDAAARHVACARKRRTPAPRASKHHESRKH